MKSKISSKKLVLNKKTISDLDKQMLKAINGGEDTTLPIPVCSTSKYPGMYCCEV